MIEPKREGVVIPLGVLISLDRKRQANNARKRKTRVAIGIVCLFGALLALGIALSIKAPRPSGAQVVYPWK